MKFENYFTIVSLEPGFINIQPTGAPKMYAGNLSVAEARRMAAHLVKIADLMAGMDDSLEERVNGRRN